VELLQALEQFGPARLLRSSFVAYPIVNAIHIAAIGALFTSVLLMDLAWLGAIRSVPRDRFVALLRRVAFLAFALAALTGLALFSIQATTYARNPAFLLKLCLIALAVLNLIVFTVLDRRNRRDAPSPAMRFCAIASILLWSGVVVAGRFIGFL
jgi:hypothetical protein